MFLFLGIAYSGPQLGSRVASYSFMKVSLDAEEKTNETERQFSRRIENREWQSVGELFASLFKFIVHSHMYTYIYVSV